MKVKSGLLNYISPWNYPNVYLFSGNNTIKKNGAVVMGRGAARQCRDRYPGIDHAFGAALKQDPYAHLLWLELYHNQHLGWFKVKHAWNEPAVRRLIERSASELAIEAEKRRNTIFHMNYPGIGNGTLDIKEVEPLLACLPDNVILYK
jgi:hypothetical protein